MYNNILFVGIPHMKSTRRVVITGIGAITPLGKNIKDTWQSILQSKSGISLLPEFDDDITPKLKDFKVKIGGIIQDYDPIKYFPKKEIKKYDPFIQYGLIACEEAWLDASIEVTEENASRIGVSMSSGIGGITTLEKTKSIIDKKGVKKISPFCIPSTIANMISGNFAIKYKLRGPNIAVVTACSTGTHNIGIAARMITYGDADVMIAGGADKVHTAIGIGGFSAAKALSNRNNEPTKASRPWDKDRDGFVLSSGGAALVLEEYETAKKRNAKIYGEIIGFGMNADAHHITKPNGIGAYECMKIAINDAQIAKDQIHHINAHGTSTKLGDVTESLAIEKLFGRDANKILVSSTKSMTGHMLGASGAIEAIFSILSIRDQIVPPTINLDNVDKDCNLNYVAHYPQKMKVNTVLSNSFGFGGTNGTLIFKRI